MTQSLREFYDEALRTSPEAAMSSLHSMALFEDADRTEARDEEDRSPDFHLRQARELRAQIQSKAAPAAAQDAFQTFYPSWKQLQTPPPIADVPPRRFGRNRRGVRGKMADGFLLLQGEDS